MSLPFRVGRDKPLDVTRAGSRVTQRGAGSGGGGGPQAPPVPVVFPPEIYPIPGARLFYSQGNVTVSNAGGTKVLTSVALLAAEVGAIRRLTLVVNNLTTTSVITFAVRFNQGPVAGYGSIAITPATAQALFIEREVVIRVPLGTSVVDVTGSVGAADAASYLLGATIEGQFWMPDQALAYAQGKVDAMMGH